MDPIVERKFQNLRRRLDQLGFRQPLDFVSLPLVEKLFSDLVHTTESLKQLKVCARMERMHPWLKL
jgi:centrosomal protein CEP135